MNKILSREFADEEMIIVLQNFYNNKNRRPYIRDFDGKKPSGDMIARRFGSWSKALEIAGIPKGKLRETDYSKTELINQIHDFIKKNDKPPTVRELKKQGYAGIKSFINHFGSFKNALIEAGVFNLREDKHQFCDTYSDEELLNSLKLYIENKTRIPTNEMMRVDLSPSVSTYDRRFGSVFNALRLIGYDYAKQQENDTIELENDMVKKYKELKEKLGRVPSSRDIEYFSRKDKTIYSMSTYEFHFGSLYELQVLCGFTPTVVGRNKSRQNLIDDLKMIAEELGKTPSQNDVKYFQNVASAATYAKEFGSWVNAVKESGLKPLGKIHYSIKGTQCLSYYELLFTNMLETYNIKFDKEVFYREYMDLDREFRFDYVLKTNSENYFIEIFGMTDNKNYEERVKYKIQLCKENQLRLIEIYPKDFTSYKLEEIHRMFLLKLKE